MVKRATSRPGNSAHRWAAALLCGLVAVGAAQAQTRPALVRSVDEPARVPYGGSFNPVCTFSNQCSVEYPVVPAGKRLRVTSIAAFVRSNTSSGAHIFALHRNDINGGNIITLVSMPPVAAAYYSTVASTTQLVDIIFEPGERPILELGLGFGQGGITANSARLTLTGYLVDVAP